MQNIFIVWLQICLVVLLSVELHHAVSLDVAKRDTKTDTMLIRARKRFIEREKKHIKERPISEDLKSFIVKARISKKKRYSSVRPKRSNEVESPRIYLMPNGTLVQMASPAKRNIEIDLDMQNYTVGPMIFPVSYSVLPFGEGDDNNVAPRISKMNVTINQDLFKTTTEDRTLSKLSTHAPSSAYPSSLTRLYPPPSIGLFPSPSVGLFPSPSPDLFLSPPSGLFPSPPSGLSPSPSSGLFASPSPSSGLFASPSPSSGLFPSPSPSPGLSPSPSPGLSPSPSSDLFPSPLPSTGLSPSQSTDLPSTLATEEDNVSARNSIKPYAPSLIRFLTSINDAPTTTKSTRKLSRYTPRVKRPKDFRHDWKTLSDILLPNLRLNADSDNSSNAIIRQRSGTAEEDEKKAGEKKADEKQILNRIVTDVETLMDMESCNVGKEGVPCEVTGAWLSDNAGMRFDIKPNGRCLEITVCEQTPPKRTGFMCSNVDWKLSGETPIPLSGLINIRATNEKDKEIASFLGECRVCSGTETIVGDWIIRRHAKDCKDRNAAQKILSDIWRKDNLLTLQKQHLDVINDQSKNATQF